MTPLPAVCSFGLMPSERGRPCVRGTSVHPKGRAKKNDNLKRKASDGNVYARQYITKRRKESKENDPNEKKEEETSITVPPSKEKVPPTVKPVEKPIYQEIIKLEFSDLGLDESKQAVLDIRDGPVSTKRGFCLAASRFETFLKWRSQEIGEETVIKNEILIEFFDTFILRHCKFGTQTPLLGPGSYWALASHVKTYILLKYFIQIPNDDITRYLKKRTKYHKVKKRAIFDFQEIADYVDGPCEDAVTRQENLIVLFSFYLLGKIKIFSK